MNPEQTCDEMQVIRYQNPENKYFHQMLNMAEDELNPYQYRLLGHYLRWCGHGGSERKGIRQTATACHMGTSTVETTRAELVEMGYLIVNKPSEEQCKDGVATEITVVDRWFENISKYQPAPKGVTNQIHPPVSENGHSEDGESNAKEMSTFLATGFAAAFAVMPIPEPDATDKENLIVPVSAIIAPTVYTVTTVQTPAPEPTMHSIHKKIIVIPTEADADEDVAAETTTKPDKTAKKLQDKAEKAAIARVFGVSPKAYGTIQCYRGMIFGTCNVTGMWKSCQLCPPATLKELDDYAEYAEDRADDKNCEIPTSTATIQRWFEDFRAEQRELARPINPLLLQKVEIIPIGMQRFLEREAAMQQAAVS